MVEDVCRRAPTARRNVGSPVARDGRPRACAGADAHPAAGEADTCSRLAGSAWACLARGTRALPHRGRRLAPPDSGIRFDPVRAIAAGASGGASSSVRLSCACGEPDMIASRRPFRLRRVPLPLSLAARAVGSRLRMHPLVGTRHVPVLAARQGSFLGGVAPVLAICDLRFAICSLQSTGQRHGVGTADCRLQIADCELQIANCKLQIGGRSSAGASSWAGSAQAETLRRRSPGAVGHLQSAICSLQFAICNLQSAICSLRPGTRCTAVPINRRRNSPQKKIFAPQQKRACASSLLADASATGFQQCARQGRGGEERGGAGTDAWRLSCQVLHKHTMD